VSHSVPKSYPKGIRQEKLIVTKWRQAEDRRGKGEAEKWRGGGDSKRARSGCPQKSNQPRFYNNSNGNPRTDQRCTKRKDRTDEWSLSQALRVRGVVRGGNRKSQIVGAYVHLSASNFDATSIEYR
jgi:hypothetical protein